MRTIAQLNESDVQQALANYFNVDVSKVKINITREYTGVGSMEHEVPRVEAEIELQNNSNDK